MAKRNACDIPQPCDPLELEPLLRAVQSGHGPSEARTFPRGALLPDGRLDLCKQQLGPGKERSLGCRCGAGSCAPEIAAPVKAHQPKALTSVTLFHNPALLPSPT